MVVVDDELVACRDGTGIRASEEERTLEDVELSQFPVLAHELHVEVGQDEDA